MLSEPEGATLETAEALLEDPVVVCCCAVAAATRAESVRCFNCIVIEWTGLVLDKETTAISIDTDRRVVRVVTQVQCS